MIPAWLYIYALDTSTLQRIQTGNFMNDNQEIMRRALANANILLAS
jgi:hypothetical protein